MLDQITPVVLTRDEEANIERTLAQLQWAREVIMIDSMSTDTTVERAKRFPNVRIVRRELDSLAGQTSFGVRQADTPWVMLLDADFFMPQTLVDELRALTPGPGVRGYRVAFDYAVDGKTLRGSLYPAKVVLFQPDHTEIWQDGHTQRFLPDGEIGTLRNRLIHDDRKSFARFVERQRRYMAQEAEKLRHADPRALSIAGRIRKLIVVAPVAVLIQTLFIKGLILDGKAGLRYAWERFVAELMLSRELLRRR